MMAMKGCPYTQKPCPGNSKGCAAWGEWEKTVSVSYDTARIEGCTLFSWSKEQMTIPKPKPAPKIKAKAKAAPKKKGAKKK